MGVFKLDIVALCGFLLTTSTSATLLPQDHGVCYIYTIQGGDTCASIAADHGITVADIEKYNTNTWAWYGCDGAWYQGNFICLGPGEPPMPVALPQATCGPQVPGTTRPSSFSELAGLNPCPSSECCTVDGLCATGSDCAKPDYCVDDCEAGASTPAPAPSPTQSSTTSTQTSTETTQESTSSFSTTPTPTSAKTTLSTSTIKTTETPETVTETQATTLTQTFSKTITAETETPTWSLSIYPDDTCGGDGGDYYTLQGHNTEDSPCLSIQNGQLSYDSTATNTWCRFYTDGGFSSTDCNGAPAFGVWSWIMRGGTCLAYEHDCGSTEAGGQSVSLDASASCSLYPWVADEMVFPWRSLRCTAKKP